MDFIEIYLVQEFKCMLSEILWDTNIGNLDSRVLKLLTIEMPIGLDLIKFLN